MKNAVITDSIIIGDGVFYLKNSRYTRSGYSSPAKKCKCSTKLARHESSFSSKTIERHEIKSNDKGINSKMQVFGKKIYPSN